jgi:uncharacterized membrane protein YuzA (DUF378 family)
MAKSIGMIFGVIYLVIGVAGLIPVSPINGTLGMAPTMLLGFASVNVLHNIVHLIIGIAGVTLSRTDAGAATFCKTFGVILLLIGLLGIWVPNPLNILPIGGYDVYLHLASGVILAVAGFATAPSR